MALVLEGTYEQSLSGLLRFYGNRALRLLPLVLAYTALSIIVFRLFSASISEVAPTGELARLVRSAEEYGWANLLQTISFGWRAELPPTITGDDALLPQLWSLAVEATFYLVAPFVVLLDRRDRRILPALILLSLAFHVLVLLSDWDWRDLVYKNFLASFASFGIGMLLARVPRHSGESWGAVVVLVPVTLIGLLLFTRLFDRLMIPGFYLAVAIAAAAVLPCKSFVEQRPRLAALDRLLGNLSYGIFLNHFVAAGVAIAAAGWLFPEVAHLRIPQEPGFVALVIWISVLLAFATHHVVEAPLEALRDRVRARQHSRGRQASTFARVAFWGAIGASLPPILLGGHLLNASNLEEALRYDDRKAVMYFLHHLDRPDGRIPYPFESAYVARGTTVPVTVALAGYGWMDAFEMLVVSASDLPREAYGTALCVAAEGGHGSVAQRIADFEAEAASIVRCKGETPAEVALRAGEGSLAEYLDDQAGGPLAGRL